MPQTIEIPSTPITSEVDIQQQYFIQLLLSSFIISPFNINKALSKENIVIAVPLRGREEEPATIGSLCSSLRKNDTSKNPYYPYIGIVNGEEKYFLENGIDEGEKFKLYIANSQILNQELEGDLSIKEQIALKIFQQALSQEDFIKCNNSKIKVLAIRSFDCAEEFVNQVIINRNDTQNEQNE